MVTVRLKPYIINLWEEEEEEEEEAK